MYYIICPNELRHHGIKGQKWGVRRFQNPDGTLTEAGRKRYGPRRMYRETKKIVGHPRSDDFSIYKDTRKKTAATELFKANMSIEQKKKVKRT